MSESIFSGYGSSRPVARELGGGMFGNVPDAFDGKSLKIGELTPNSRRKQLELAKIQEFELDENFYKNNKSEKLRGEGDENDDPKSGGENVTQIEEKLKSDCITIMGAKNKILIQGGEVVNDDQSFLADVYIEDGVIKDVGLNLPVPDGATKINATNKIIIPGGIDPRTHFGFQYNNGIQSVDDVTSGTRAALAGGTTMILDTVELTEGQSIVEGVEERKKEMTEKACCDYALCASITEINEKLKADMETLTKQKGINSFVMKMTSPGLDNTALYQVFRKCAELGALPQVQAESAPIKQIKAQELIDSGVTGPEGSLLCSPEESEYSSVCWALGLSSAADCPVYISKLCSPVTAEAVADARHQGKVVFGETLGSALGTNGKELFNKDWRHAAAFVTSPPLRDSPVVQEQLIDLLRSNDLQTVASDHLSFKGDQKAAGKADFRQIPAGTNGCEERMSILWQHGVVQGKITPREFVAATSSNAAKIFNIYPKKGRISVGSDADVVVFDPKLKREISAKTHHHKGDFNIFEGQQCQGQPVFVISGGKIAFDNEGLHANCGDGQFVSLSCNGEFIYARLKEKQKASPLVSVARDPYDGPVCKEVEPEAIHIRSDNPIMPAHPDTFYNRPNTSGGGRHMQDSSFHLSGAQYDEKVNKSCGYRVSNPPGGRSTGSLW